MAVIGDTLHIMWDSTDWLDPDGGQLPVMIELSRDGGGTWETIVASTTDDGLYDWVITGPASNDCLLRYSDPTDPTVYFDGNSFRITTTAEGVVIRSKMSLSLSL
jgi:hypothetical protein